MTNEVPYRIRDIDHEYVVQLGGLTRFKQVLFIRPRRRTSAELSDRRSSHTCVITTLSNDYKDEDDKSSEYSYIQKLRKVGNVLRK